MGRSPGFGSIRTSSDAHFGLAFAAPPAGLTALDLLARITRRIIMQKARPHSLRSSDCCVGSRFQVLFHSASAVLFTFPSRYWCTIGFRRVFSLGGWAPRLPIGFHVSDGNWERLPFCESKMSSTGLSPSMVGRSRPFDYLDTQNERA